MQVHTDGSIRQDILQPGGQPADLQQIDAAAAAEVAQAMAVADAAPWPEATAAYTDIQSTGEGQWF
jgi:pyruvate dehydrogenase E1 component alpha subunit